MINNLQSLLNYFKKSDLTQETYLLDLLIKFAGYDDEWRDKIYDLSLQNTKPFNHWLGGKSRIYLDFKPTDKWSVDPDPDVESALSAAGYEITDYVGGYCEKNGRTFRIGKIIQELKKEELKQIKEKYEEGNSNFPVFLNTIEAKWNGINNQFLNSPYRRNKKYRDDLKIVISQDPHDLATMSYERGWTSCMTLGEGEYHSNVFTEVSCGGLVAYLISGEDTEIEHPLARLHIRRFVGRNGINIAQPEGSVYGNEVPGFSEAVNQWVSQRNQEEYEKFKTQPEGIYTRKGGDYSDTFGEKLIITPQTQEGLIKWFNQELPDTKETTWTVRDNYYDDLEDAGYMSDYQDYFDEDYEGEKTFDRKEDAERFLDHLRYLDPDDSWIDYMLSGSQQEEMSEDVLDQAMDQLREDRFSIKENTKDHSVELRQEAVKKLVDNYLDEMDPELGKSLLDYTEKHRLNTDTQKYEDKLLIQFPELLTKEKFNGFTLERERELIKAMKKAEGQGEPTFSNMFYQWFKEKSFNLLDVNSTEFKERLKRALIDFSFNRNVEPNYAQKVRLDVVRMIDDMAGDHIDDEFYSHLRKFLFKEVEHLPRLEDSPKEISKLYRDVIRKIKPEMLNSNAAIDFAKQMWSKLDITEWGYTNYSEQFAVDEWLWFVRGLGENGKIFIPTIKLVIQNAEDDLEANELYQKIMTDPALKEMRRQRLETKPKEVESRIRRAMATIDCIENNVGWSVKYPWNSY